MVSELQRQILEYLEANHPHRVRFQYMVADFPLEEKTLASELFALEKEKLVQLTKFKIEGTNDIGIHSINLSERGLIWLTEFRESNNELSSSKERG